MRRAAFDKGAEKFALDPHRIVRSLDIALISTGPSDDLYVSAFRRGDEDVLAHGLHMNGSSNEPVEIALKANGGMVKVLARTPKGEPFPEANVSLLPDSRAESKQRYMAIALRMPAECAHFVASRQGSTVPSRYPKIWESIFAIRTSPRNSRNRPKL